MTDTDLPWRIFGRIIRPYALAVSLATGIIAYACAASIAVGQLHGPPGRIAAAAAAAAVALLWAGWWARSDRLMRGGLFVTTGVWAAVWMVLSLDIGFGSVSAMLAGCWAIASGGAWLLEVTDRQDDE